MTHLSTVEARRQFAELINRVAYGKERVILTRRGKALAAVIPIEYIQVLDAAIGTVKQFPTSEACENILLLDSEYNRVQEAD